jgi:ABC-type sugar transport system ATPase subunit
VIKALFGLKPVSSGSIEIDGERLTISSPKASIEQGLAYVPEDRKADGLFLNKSVHFNSWPTPWKGTSPSWASSSRSGLPNPLRSIW